MPIRRRHRRDRVTVVYANDAREEKRDPSPWLKNGDAASKKKFRVTYLKYVRKHVNDQRSKPYDHHTNPKTVVECIDPDLLWYAYKFELKPKRFRTDHPEAADAKAVYRWAMAKEKKRVASRRRRRHKINQGPQVRTYWC